MAEKKGKTTKKILHLGHILLEFFRKILKAMGKSSKKPPKVEETGAHGDKGGIGKGATKAAATKSSSGAASETTATALDGATSSGGAIGTTGAAGTSIGVSISGTTILTVFGVAAVLIIGGMATYCIETGLNPLNLIQDMMNGDTNNAEVSNPYIPFLPQSGDYTPDNSQQSGQTVTYSTSTVDDYDPNSEAGTTESSIEYTVPENP